MKGYENAYSALPFVPAFIAHATACIMKTSVTVVYLEYLELVRLVMNLGKLNGFKAANITIITDKASELQRLIVARFQDHCSNWLPTLTFHLLDHLTEDL